MSDRNNSSKDESARAAFAKTFGRRPDGTHDEAWIHGYTVALRSAGETGAERACEGACETPRLCRVSHECLFARYVKNRQQEPDCRSNGSQALCSAWPACRCGRAGAEHFKALKLIRDGAIPQGMSAALFADCVLRVPPEKAAARLCPKCDRTVTEGCNYVACPYPIPRSSGVMYDTVEDAVAAQKTEGNAP